MIIPLKDRFFSKIVRGQTEDDCWGWTATKNNKGYGALKVNGQMAPINRVSWMVHFGEIPKGLCVCHSCDNPICSNPKHLFLGTHQDNMDDMIRKGRDRKDAQKALRNRSRSYKGMGSSTAKLTDEQVREIKRLAVGRKIGFGKQIAERFGVIPATIGHILSGRNWSHIQ